MITGVVGITLWTDDLDRLFRFYHDTLGIPLHSNHGDYIALELSGVRFNIGLHNGVNGPAKDPFRIMPHLGVSDIHDLYRRLSDSGVEFIRPPEKEGWGGWVATFKDPDGNIVQLLQFPQAGE